MRIKRWDEQLSKKGMYALTSELAHYHLAQVFSDEGVRIGREIVKFLTADDYASLCKVGLDYTKLHPADACQLRQVLALYTKRADLSIEGVDRREVAREKFWAAEALCEQTNELFRDWAAGRVNFLPAVEEVLYLAQRKVATILNGKNCQWDIPDVSDLRVRFGPGATTQVQKRNASARSKLGQTYCCSEEFLEILSKGLEELQGWLPEGDADTVSVPVEVHPGKLSFVPKDMRSDRAIVVEPMLNTMFQLGINDVLVNRLLHAGVDLTDQTLNQRLAREGSLTGALATLDLSSASDTIAIELVAHLLPVDWFLFLSQFRTGTVVDGDREIRLQKFSSMGNGFTFPLESLLFFALASAAVEVAGERGRVSVYGDDIIMPTGAVDVFRSTLDACGFILNAEKSYASGPFRESCGKDYLSGIDIRPLYIKGALSGSDAFVLHNQYIRTMQPEAAAIVLKYVNPPLYLWGPDGFGDGHLLGDHHPKPHRRDRGWAGYIFDTYTFKSRKSFRPYPGDRVLPSYTIYASPPQMGLPGIKPSKLQQRMDEYGRPVGYYDCIPGQFSYKKDGSLGVTTPGTRGYSRISIYTLVPTM